MSMPRPKTQIRSLLSLLIATIVLVYMAFNLSRWRDRNMLEWDCGNYYLYLPAVFIYHDLGNAAFFTDIVHKYYLNGGNTDYGLYPQEETGKRVNKYAVGTALFEMPFFLIAHAYALNSGDEEEPPDGFSEPYRIAQAFSLIFWAIAGLFAIRSLLLRYFDDTVVAVTLLLLLFASNLYFYIVFNQGMSHPYSFAAFAFLLSLTDRFYASPKLKYAVAIGLMGGIIVLLRPTNIIVLLLPLCWPLPADRGGIVGRLAFLKTNRLAVLLAVLLFGLTAMVQFAYCKYTAGHWFHFTYQDEGFNFLDPHIIDGLFSYRKGWFVYTPVALVAILGLFALYRVNRGLSWLIFAYCAVNIYVVFSWYFWSYGGSFGARALIESMAVLSLPLAAIVRQLVRSRSVALRVSSLVLFCLLITLNMFQSYQLSLNVMQWDGTNRAFYWRIFGKVEITDEDRKLLQQ